MENKAGAPTNAENETLNVSQVKDILREKGLLIFEPTLNTVVEHLQDNDLSLTTEEVASFLYAVFKPIDKAVKNLPEALAFRQMEQQLDGKSVKQFLADLEDVQTNAQSGQSNQTTSSALEHSPAQKDGGPVTGWRSLTTDNKTPDSLITDHSKAESPTNQGPVLGWKGTLEGEKAPEPKKIS
jgi:hypothetical protein